MTADGSARRTPSGAMGHDAHASSIVRDSRFSPARIRLLYESKDGKLCLFEDAQGHITSVRAAKLA